VQDNSIFTIVLGNVLRHFLTGVAVLLGAYGVSAEQQSQLVNASVSIAVALVIALATQVWSYFSKKAALKAMPPIIDTTGAE